MTIPMDTRNRSTLFKGLVVNVEQMEVRIGNKGWHLFQVVKHPGGVAVLPLHDDGTITLIRQLRPSVEKELLEIPAGRKNPGEEPAECGRRELIEETGLSAGSLIPLGTFYPSPGVFDEMIHLYLATGLSQGIAEPEFYEEIETVRIPFDEALRMAESNEQIQDGKTIVALMRAKRLLP
jgi:ADP-ribose pyrophosphatase